MKKLVLLLMILTMGALVAAPASADTEIDISGQIRVRSEGDGRSFDTSTIAGTHTLMRTRVNLAAEASRNTSAFIQFQDSRTLGGANQSGAWQSGGLNDGRNVDLHQAYINIDRLWIDGLGIKAGRFEFTMGNQRVLGSVGWHNVGRSWEGGLHWYQAKAFKVTAFVLKAQEEMETQGVLANRDFNIYGGLLEFENLPLEVLGIYEMDRDTLYSAPDSIVLAGNKLERMTLGWYYQRDYSDLDFEFNFAYQLGSQLDTVDISAMMFTGEVGYNFQCKRRTRVAFGIDYASGDDDPSDNDHKAYNNLYYTGHKFRGFMDYFVASGDAGLMDIMFRTKMNPHRKWTFKGDFHLFKTAADYSYPVAGGSTALCSDAGMEFDFGLSTSSVVGVKLAGGVSVFLPKKNFVTKTLYASAPSGLNDADKATWALSRTNDDMTVWAWGQAILNF